MRLRGYGQSCAVIWPAAAEAGALRVPLQLKIDGGEDLGEDGSQCWRFRLLNAAHEWHWSPDRPARRTLNLDVLTDSLLEWLDPHVYPDDPKEFRKC